MQIKKHAPIIIAGVCAGAVNGLFGAGGGMILVPLLTILTDLDEQEIFPASVSIILPMCFVSLAFSFYHGSIADFPIIPYLIGSAAGGILAGFLQRKIPTIWLHRMLGIFILWGGIKYLC